MVMKLIFSLAVCSVLVGLAFAEVPKANLSEFRKDIGPVLKAACVECHGPNKQKGKFRIDTLNPDLLNGEHVSWWLEVFGVIGNGEMPPKDAKVQLEDAERALVVDWLSREIQQASRVARSAKGRSSFRRLTRYEYDYALRDLLGLDHSLVDRLPPETASEDGFKNSSELLQMSAMQFQTHREIGLKALRRAIVIGERPKPVNYVFRMEELFEKASKAKQAKVFQRETDGYSNHRKQQHLLNRQTGKGVAFSGGKYAPVADTAVGQAPQASAVYMELPRNHEWKINLDRFLPDEGLMRVSMRAARSTKDVPGDICLRLGFSAHTSNNANFSNVISERDLPVTAPANRPEFIHFDIQLGDIQRNPFRKLTTTFPRRDEFLHIRNVSLANGLHVQFDHVEITVPFYEQWPPKTHTAIFFESQNNGNAEVYAREVLERFMWRAWRRPVTKPEVDRFVKLFAKYRPQFETFEGAMVEVLATVLAHPEFLYLAQRDAEESEEAPSRISQFELADRLAVFLWSSIPDETVLDLAQRGKLREPKVLSAQVERMLADPRAKRFTRHFVRQWLGLDGLNSVDHIRDDQLKAAMEEEPVAFFEHVLNANGSIMDFIHSDYAVVNDKLAQHYRIPDVHGVHFRKVAIEVKHQRGGLMTGAAVLAMNSDGKDSHPLKRGIWMLERILHDPPPPPPPNVPEVDLADPEIARMTLKERIADHRDDPACYSCHARIDPWGIAFENYDAMGSFRNSIKGKPVDATSKLFNKQPLAGMEGLKRYLLAERQDQFARAMAHKMTAYALGRHLTFADRADVEELTTQFRTKGDRLRHLIQLLVQSRIFHSK
jgi:mono/diheme cytochrome c family protein